LFQAVSAYRLQETPSGWRNRTDGLTQRLGNETGQLLEKRLVGSADAAHGLNGLERKPRREDSKVTQQTLLLLRQQLVAPVERGAQRPVLRNRGASPASQERKAIAQADGHLLGPHERGAGCSELDGERNAVELPTDLRDRWEIARLRREARVQRLRPGDE